MRIRKAFTTMPFSGGLSTPTEKSRQSPWMGGGPFDRERTDFDLNSGGDHKFINPPPDGTSYAVGGCFVGEVTPGGDPDIPYETEIVITDRDGKEHVDVEHDYNKVLEIWSGKGYIKIERRRRIQSVKKASSGGGRDLIPIVADVVSACFKIESESSKYGKREIGSCFAVSPDIFVTCAHVISRKSENPSDVACYIIDGDRRHKAVIVDVDYKTDIALVRCGGVKHAYLGMKGISSMAAGAAILCVGSPYGYDNNVSRGIISSIERSVDGGDGVSYFFVDLSIYPGSSGGPIVDVSDSTVVGVAAMIVQPVGNYGLNAAIPSEYVQRMLNNGSSS